MELIKAFFGSLDFHAYPFISSLAIILMFVKIAGFISQAFGQPAVLGEIIMGILLGPSFFDWVQPNLTLDNLSEIGVILLMFIAGLETDTAIMKRSFKTAMLVALGGVILPFAGGFLTGQWLGYAFGASLFLGTILVATSVSISVQVLRELDKLSSVEGAAILGAAVIDDILGILVLSIVTGLVLTQSHHESGTVSFVLIKICLFFLLSLGIGRYLAPLFMTHFGKLNISHVFLTGAFILAFSFSYFAELLGLTGIVGAYLVGMLLADTKHQKRIIKPIEIVGFSFFIPIFFANIGISANFSEFNAKLLGLASIITLVAIITKMAGCMIGAKLSGTNYTTAKRIGAGMVARGEVGLIVAMIGLKRGIIEHDIFTVTIFMVVVTTLITPSLLKMFYE